MQSSPEIAFVEQSPEPVELVPGFEKRMLAEDRLVMFIHGSLDRAYQTFGCCRDTPHVQGDKLQMVGIDMPRLDETSRLFCTAAGVIGIDQTTLAVHELVKITAGAGEALAEVVGGDFEDVAADLVSDSQNFAEREDQPLLAVKAEQHPHRAGNFRLLNKERHFDGNRLRVGQIEIRRRVDRAGVAGKSLNVPLGTATSHIQNMVSSDAVEPGAKLALPLERAEASDHLDQHFLGHFLGILRVKDHADGDVVDPRLVPEHKLLERLTTPLPGLFDEVGIGRFIGDFGEGIVHCEIPRTGTGSQFSMGFTAWTHKGMPCDRRFKKAVSSRKRN